jgi:hypothetical protein
MQKIVLFLLISMQMPIKASPLVALEKAKQDLIVGKQKVTQGKRDVQEGYFKIRAVTSQLADAATGVQPMLCTLTTVDKYAGDIVDAMGALTPSILVMPPIGAAATIGLTLMIGVPDVITSIKNILTSVIGTLNTTKIIIDPVNEKMNPGLIGFALHAESSIAQIQDLLNNNKGKLKPDFVTSVNNIITALNPLITLAKTRTYFATGGFADPANDVNQFGNKYTDLLVAYRDAKLSNYGSKVVLSQNILKCPVLGDDPVLNNAPVVDKDKDVQSWTDTQKNVVAPIANFLSQMRPDAWARAAQIDMQTRSLMQNWSKLPVMYQQFYVAEQKFDLAIAKLDEIITGFKAALAAAEDDGS